MDVLHLMMLSPSQSQMSLEIHHMDIVGTPIRAVLPELTADPITDDQPSSSNQIRSQGEPRPGDSEEGTYADKMKSKPTNQVDDSDEEWKSIHEYKE